VPIVSRPPSGIASLAICDKVNQHLFYLPGISPHHHGASRKVQVDYNILSDNPDQHFLQAENEINLC